VMFSRRKSDLWFIGRLLRRGMIRIAVRVAWYVVTKPVRRWWRRRARRLATDQEIWITAKGVRIPVAEMEMRHLLNAQAYVARHADRKLFDPRWPRIFADEIHRRAVRATAERVQ